MIKPSIFKGFKHVAQNSPQIGGQVKRLPHFFKCDSPFCVYRKIILKNDYFLPVTPNALRSYHAGMILGIKIGRAHV